MTEAVVPGTTVPGATRRADGATRFVVAAAGRARVEVLVKAGNAPAGTAPAGRPSAGAPTADDRILALAPADEDRALPLCWHRWEGDVDFTGRRYRVRVDDGPWLPDPASRWNPDDVHGDSVVVDGSGFAWQHDTWAGLAWHRFVIHEIHIGCFTEAGTFAAAAERLPALAALGITAIEVMPVADFAGRRNWGYDGVLPYAPDASYGTPDDFRRFVDTAHGLGMAVILDVVYNHFGPEGNYLHGLAPAFFNSDRQTPWGAALNVDGPGSAAVRAFFIENAWYWIDAFRLDGLRLDAVHAIADESPSHLVAELARTVSARLDAAASAGSAGPAGARRRAVHLIVENERNQASWLDRDAAGRPRVATAQWNDDIHHALHVLLTGETDGYYVDFAQAPARLLADGLARGFIYRGQHSRHLDAPRGEPSEGLPPTALINCLQNHDQIGNRAFGERITTLAPARAVAVASACILLGPAIPMLFMGEEFAATTPFLYFCDYDGDLAEAVRRGRRREFARFARFADPQTREQIPDPNDEATFTRSRLAWPGDGDTPASIAGSASAPIPAPPSAPTPLAAIHRRGLAARRRWVEPLLAAGDVPVADDTMLGERAFVVRWRFAGGSLALAASFGQAGGAPLPTVDGCQPVWRLDADGPPPDGPPLEAALAAWDLVLFRDPGATPGP